jgi:esterase/lipase
MNITKLDINCPGYAIAADWYEGDQTDIMLVLPAYTSSRARIKDIVQTICQGTGMSALVIDYSGHGDSPFELRDTRPAQHFLEAVIAFDWVKNKYLKARITVFGPSYGGFLAAQLTQYRIFDRLILRVPAIYKPHTFYDLWAARIDNLESYNKDILVYRNDKAELIEHPLFGRASSFEGKTLVVIHDNDEMVPKATTDAFIKAFHADSFVQPGFLHNIGDAVEEGRVGKDELEAYKQKYVAWLRQN